MRAVLPLPLALALLAVPPALAGGFEHTGVGPRAIARSGAVTARADGALTLRYNPATVVRLGGHRFESGLRLSIGDLSYTRSGVDHLLVTAGHPDAPYRTAHVRDEAYVSPATSAAWAWGDGTFGLGLGAWAPGGHGRLDFPVDGPQRFQLTEMHVALAVTGLTVAAAPHEAVSVGASLEWLAMPWQQLGVVVDTTTLPAQTDEAAGIHLAHGAVDVADWASFAATLGVHVVAAPWLELGVAARPHPVVLRASGDVDLRYLNPGTADLAAAGYVGLFDAAGEPDPRVRVRTVLPPWVRLGVRAIVRDGAGDEIVDVELDAGWEGWHLMDGYTLTFAGGLKEPFGAPPRELEPLHVPRHLRDAWSVRLGTDVRVWPGHLWLRGGVHYESPAASPGYTALDLPSFHRLGVGWGFGLRIWKVRLDAAYQLVWQPDWVVGEAEAQLPALRPASQPWDPEGEGGETWPGAPLNAGRYRAHFHTVVASLGVELP